MGGPDMQENGTYSIPADAETLAEQYKGQSAISRATQVLRDFYIYLNNSGMR